MVRVNTCSLYRGFVFVSLSCVLRFAWVMMSALWRCLRGTGASAVLLMRWGFGSPSSFAV